MTLLSLPAAAQSFLEDLRLVELRDDTAQAQRARALSYGGYELSNGQQVSFTDWYSADGNDITATWMAPLRDDLGLYIGFNTGEAGEKYEIEPGVRLGFLYVRDLTPSSNLSLSAIAVLGGRLKEESCTADYGAIGGRQTVNCRLAATTLPPDETLDHLVDEAPPEHLQLSLRYSWRF